MAQKFTVPITVRQLTSAGSDAITVYVDADTYARLKVEAGGRLTWGSGSGAGDVNLYRDEADVLRTDDTFKTPVLFVDGIEIDPTGAVTDHVLKYNGTKFVSASATFGGGANALNDLTDVTVTSPEKYQTLVYDGTGWINEFPTTVTLVNNAEATTLQIGEAVYLYGNVGNHASVKRADNDSDTTSAKTLGLVAAAIPAGGNGPVVTRGYVTGMNLSVGYTAGQSLYLGEDGGFTTSKPSAPEHIVFIGVVVRATNNGIIYVAAQNGYELDELHNVKINGLADGDYLRYNSASALWVNDQINLGSDTVGNYVVNVSGGTGVTVTHTPGEGSTPTVAIGQSVATSASVTFAQITTTGNVTVGGNLTVNGTTTSINTETLTIDDNLIVLNNNVTNSPTENAGIEVERGTSTNVQLRWNETTDKWQFTNDGTTYTDLGAGGATISASAPGSPTAGALWFDSVGGGTYVYYDSSWIEIGASGSGARVTVSSGAPASPSEGDMWFDSDTGQTFVYYDSTWVEVGASGFAAVVADVAPSNPVAGQLWLNSTDGGTYIYYDSVWMEVGAAPFNSLLSTINAKGDLLVGTADDTIGRLATGTSGQVLSVNTSTTTGLEWTTLNYAPSASPTFTGTVVLPSSTSIGNVSSTEIGYLDGVTSAIQTQLDTKASTGKAIAMAIVFGG